MPMCKECGAVVSAMDIKDGLCPKCLNPEIIKKIEIREKKKKDIEYNSKNINKVWTTTETTISEPIEERIEIVFSQAVYGMNLAKNFLTDIRDIVGGRVGNIENAMQAANRTVIRELKEEAYLLDADAVIGVQLHYETTGKMLSVVATGTAIKLK